MTNPEVPAPPAQPRTRSNCFVAGGVTCLVVVIVLVLLGIWIYRWAANNPAVKHAFTGIKLVTECQMQLVSPSGNQDVYHAVERYRTRYGKYPVKLDDLYPTFLANRALLHCPADPRAKDVVSYEYTPPATNAPGSTVMVECKWHVIQEGQPPLVLRLCKDGRVLQQGYTTHGTPAEH